MMNPPPIDGIAVPITVMKEAPRTIGEGDHHLLRKAQAAQAMVLLECPFDIGMTTTPSSRDEGMCAVVHSMNEWESSGSLKSGTSCYTT